MRLRNSHAIVYIAGIVFLLVACTTTPTVYPQPAKSRTATPVLAGGEPILPHSQILLRPAPLPTATDYQFSSDAWTLSGHDSYATHAVTVAACCSPSPAPLWYHPFDSSLLSPPVIADGHIYQLATDGYLHVLDAQTGDEQERMLVGGTLAMNGIALAHGMLYLAREGHILVALDAQSGRERWHFDTMSIIHAAPLVVGRLALIESGANTLFCLDAFTGQEYWVFHSEDTLSQFWPTHTTPVLADNIVYVAPGASNEFNALDVHTGHKLWEVSLHERMTGGPLVDRVSGLVYVVTWSGRLAAFDQHSGKQRWFISLPTGSEASPALAQNLHTLYIGGYDGNLYALDARTGQILWHRATGGAIAVAPTVLQTTLYTWLIVASQSGNYLILDARTGKQLYSWKLGELRTTPIVTAHMLYQASLGDQGLFAFML